MGFIDYLRLIRPQQWYKNLLVFLPLIFVGKALDFSLVWVIILGFVSLSLASSFNYIVNDIIDRKKDKVHPEKRKRPIASGKVSVLAGFGIAVVLLALALRLAFILDRKFFAAVILIVVLTQIYSLFLKKIAFADILVIGINFVIRAVSGAFIISVSISPWLILCTFFAALFLASGKRHSDMLFLGKKAIAHKESLAFYTKDITNTLMIITTTLLIASYCFYAVLSEHKYLVLSIPFALFAIFRYFSLIYSGSPVARHPEKVFKDWQMLIGMALWGITVFIVLYVLPQAMSA